MQQTGTAETLNCKSFVILHWMFHRSNWWVSPWHAVRHLMEITAQNEEFIRNVNTGVWKISFLFADRGTTPVSFPGWYGNRAIRVNPFTNLTFCLLISWTMFQQHQPTHEVSETNALLCCSKCTEYGLPKQQSSITNTHTGWSSLLTQHCNQDAQAAGFVSPTFSLFAVWMVA